MLVPLSASSNGFCRVAGITVFVFRIKMAIAMAMQTKQKVLDACQFIKGKSERNGTKLTFMYNRMLFIVLKSISETILFSLLANAFFRLDYSAYKHMFFSGDQ